MKKYLLILFIVSVNILYSQNREEFLPLSKMNLEEQKMYDLLKKCVLKKSIQPNKVHFFSSYFVVKNEKWIELNTYIYDEPKYDLCEYIAYSSRYLVSVKFFKNEVNYEELLVEEPIKVNKLNKTIYNFNITEQPDTENKTAMNYKEPETIINVKSPKPIFENKFSKAYFKKWAIFNEIDKSTYKNEENSYNRYYSNFAIIYKDKNFGIINKANKTIIPFEYQSLILTKFGLLASNKNNKYFFIDSNNKVISKYYDNIKYDLFCQYYQLDDYLLVKNNGLYNILDTNLNEKLDSNYDEITLIDKPLQILAFKNGKQVIIDVNNLKETNIKYDKFTNIDGKIMIVEIDKKFGLVRRDNFILLEVKYENIKCSFDNFPKFFFLVTEGNKVGLVNKEGQLVTDIKYDSIEYSTKTELFEGKRDNKLELFDSEGILIK